MNPYNIYISGVGGQGIIKTSIIMGEAAMKMGTSVVMSEVHGMAQRGGVVSTELKIGRAQSPIIQEGHVNLLIAFEPLETLRVLNKASKKTFILINTAPIIPFNINESEQPYPNISVILKELKSKSKKLYAMNAAQMAEEAGHSLSLNMILLGRAAAIPAFPLDKELLIESMKDNLPKKSLEINLNAFNIGFKTVSN